MTTLEAIYENGVFKPIQPVSLPDKQRVQIDVHPIEMFNADLWLARVRSRQQEIVARVGVLPDSALDVAADRRRDG